MRKLLLTTAIVLITSSALASGPRGLSAPQPAEPQRPFRQAEVTILPAPGEQPAATTTTESAPQTMQDKLKAAGELKPDGTPAKPVQVPPPVQPAPVQAQPAPVQTQTTAQATQPVQKPAKTRVVRKRESDEHKARRIAAKFGIHW
jgi:cell division septation protein DedD